MAYQPFKESIVMDGITEVVNVGIAPRLAYYVAGRFLDIVQNFIVQVYQETIQSIKEFFGDLLNLPTLDFNFDLSRFERVISSSEATLDINLSNFPLIIFGALLAFFALILFIRLSIAVLPIYAITPWGFRGKLIYADDHGEKRLFTNKSYRLVVNPDFVYRLRSSHIAYIEYKSRTYVMESDIAQLEVGILALRGTHNVRRGAIALSNGELHWVSSAKRSSRYLYKKNKKYIKEVVSIKAGKWVAPIKKPQCNKCPMAKKCWS